MIELSMRHWPCGCPYPSRKVRVHGIAWIYDRSIGWHDPHHEHVAFWPVAS